MSPAAAEAGRLAAEPHGRSLLARLGTARQAFATYRRKRRVYRQLLRELQSYRPHELQDLQLRPEEFERLARQQAGL